MSRWSNSTLAIGLGACELALRVYPSRLRQVFRAAHEEAPVQVALGEHLRFTETGALDALRDALRAYGEATGRGAAARWPACAVLDDFWANHAILRGDFRALSVRETEEIVLAHFADTYGLDGASLRVRFSVQRGGRALFASAMAGTLHDGIVEAGASAGVDIARVRLCLPQLLERTGKAVDGHDAMLLFVLDTLLQAVIVKDDCWVAYDVQRLFPGDAVDAARLAILAEQVFERSAGTRREDCTLYVCGTDADLAPLAARFAAVVRLPVPAATSSSTAITSTIASTSATTCAQRLTELAR